MTIHLHPRDVARALVGDVIGDSAVLAPGPGHSRADRSLSIKIDPAVPDGFIVHSFAGDSPIACRDYVRAALGLNRGQRRHKQSVLGRPASRAVLLHADADDRSAFALRLWNEARDPRGTTVESYLASRALTLPEDVAGDVIRFHPALKFNGVLSGAMVALFRDIRTNETRGIHRTFLDSTGRKLDRKMLGRAKHAAIKLDADESVALGLTIGEGLETCLAALLAGFRPIWALGSVAGIAAFPVLPGVDALTILAENDANGANTCAIKQCAARWHSTGREVFSVEPLVGKDLNDAWSGP